MKFRLFIISALVSLVLFSCNKDKNDDPKPQGTPEYGGTYWPTKVGNEWCYTGDLTYCTKITKNTYTTNGKTYAVLETTQGGTTSTGYLRVKDGVYYQINPQAYGGSDEEIIMLKENASIGETWSFTISPNANSDNIYTFEMQGQVGPQTVGSDTYNDVIAVTLTTDTYFFGSLFFTLNQTIYYAKDVGFIFQTTDWGGDVQLDSYTLN